MTVLSSLLEYAGKKALRDEIDEMIVGLRIRELGASDRTNATRNAEATYI